MSLGDRDMWISEFLASQASQEYTVKLNLKKQKQICPCWVQWYMSGNPGTQEVDSGEWRVQGQLKLLENHALKMEKQNKTKKQLIVLKFALQVEGGWNVSYNI